MPDHEARTRAVYDHQHDEPGEDRRRRPVADWGVGEELFDRMPSRRFSRTESARTRARRGDGRVPGGGVADGRRTIVIAERADDELVDAPATRAEALRDAAAAGEDRATDVWGQAETSPPRSTADGRRTIVIGGRPERGALPATYRRRPPRTSAERLGASPDRIVAYAVALGLLLILIAILSAH